MAAEPMSKKDAALAESPYKTNYVVEEKPSLPSQNIDVQRDEPMIDSRLVEMRNAEAKAQADRLKG